MSTTISQLTPVDLKAVDKLRKRYSQTLGFLTSEALLDYLKKGGVLGVKTDVGQLVGYLLYGAYPSYFRITHLCVAEEYRNQGIARRLVNHLKKTADTQKVIRLTCRRDFLANDLWPTLGFVPLGEKPSQSKEKHSLIIWHLTLDLADQLELFHVKPSDGSHNIIIDAQIFFDFDESDNDKTKPSKMLLLDSYSLNVLVTDELFTEINRQEDPEKRKKSLNRAHNFPKVEFNPHLIEGFVESLKEFLPENRKSQESDVRHLAKAAASNVKTFVTRDSVLLGKAKEIADVTGLKVIDPVNFIVQLHESSRKQFYVPDHIAGPNLRWNRLTSGDLLSFPFDSFLQVQERKGKFKEKLESLIAQPNLYECELLRAGDETIAIRILTINSKVLFSPLTRIARTADRLLFGHFLIADTISKAVEKNLDVVKFEVSNLTNDLKSDLVKLGFIECKDNFVRFCFSSCLDRKAVLSAISTLYPESTSDYQDMSDLELERYCSPLGLDTAEQKYFLVPIRPGYAISLIDRHQSANELFGGDPDVLLLWENVYYRAATLYKMLTPPGRILWYVSRPKQQIIGISHLDEVVINTPKILFREFQKFGVLRWRDLYEMSGEDPLKELMALKFSHTFLFREPVSLDVVKTVFKENGRKRPWLQSPLEIPPKIFYDLFEKGYPNQQ